MYFVYILNCSDNTLYCGVTNDLERRIKQHNGTIKGGAKYTLGRKPTILVYSEEFEQQGEALRRELEIKKLTRLEKLNLISQNTHQ